MKIRYLGLVDYCTTLRAMQQFTAQRTDATEDELWILEHPPTFTQGQAGKPEHILQKSDIPIVQVDRGGQVTYHAPGQLIIYTLINFKRRKIGIRSLVEGLERAIITTLNHYGIDAESRRDAPGVYVDGKKIASLGLRIKNGATYHGLSLNVDMNLTPFSYINPCGHQGLEMTQVADLIESPPAIDTIANTLIHHLQKNIGR